MSELSKVWKKIHLQCVFNAIKNAVEFYHILNQFENIKRSIHNFGFELSSGGLITIHNKSVSLIS